MENIEAKNIKLSFSIESLKCFLANESISNNKKWYYVHRDFIFLFNNVNRKDFTSEEFGKTFKIPFSGASPYKVESIRFKQENSIWDKVIEFNNKVTNYLYPSQIIFIYPDYTLPDNISPIEFLISLGYIIENRNIIIPEKLLSRFIISRKNTTKVNLDSISIDYEDKSRLELTLQNNSNNYVISNAKLFNKGNEIKIKYSSFFESLKLE